MWFLWSLYFLFSNSFISLSIRGLFRIRVKSNLSALPRQVGILRADCTQMKLREKNPLGKRHIRYVSFAVGTKTPLKTTTVAEGISEGYDVAKKGTKITCFWYTLSGPENVSSTNPGHERWIDSVRDVAFVGGYYFLHVS